MKNSAPADRCVLRNRLKHLSQQENSALPFKNIFALAFKLSTIPVQIFAIPLARDWSEELGKAGAGKVKLH